MARIKATDTRPEMIVRRYLHHCGFRFRKHVKALPGNPDLVLKKHSLAILVHGCFWHQHPGCKFASRPKSNTQYWGPKLNRNVERDRININELINTGWRVLIIWECAVSKKGESLAWLPQWILSSEIFFEWPIFNT